MFADDVLQTAIVALGVVGLVDAVAGEAAKGFDGAPIRKLDGLSVVVGKIQHARVLPVEKVHQQEALFDAQVAIKSRVLNHQTFFIII